MITWYLIITAIIFVIALVSSLHWKSEYKSSVKQIEKKQFQERSGNYRHWTLAQLEGFLVKEQRATKWSVYTMFLSPFWPALVVVLPAWALKILIINITDAVKIAVKGT